VKGYRAQRERNTCKDIIRDIVRDLGHTEESRHKSVKTGRHFFLRESFISFL
jgi:hypothetical protein